MSKVKTLKQLTKEQLKEKKKATKLKLRKAQRKERKRSLKAVETGKECPMCGGVLIWAMPEVSQCRGCGRFERVSTLKLIEEVMASRVTVRVKA